MNEHFVNVKVDREERPDIDQIYQTAHQMLTQRAGGWPLTMFLTPRPDAVLRRHVLPEARRATACRGSPTCCERVARVLPRAARRRSRAERARCVGALERMRPRGGAAAPEAFSDEPLIAEAVGALKSSFDRDARRLRRRAEVPASRRDIELLPAPLRRDRRPRTRCDVATFTLEQHGRRAASTTSSAAASAATAWTRLDHPALREDALRQRPAAAPVRRRVGCDRRAALRARVRGDRGLGRCARCSRPRAATTPRSTPTPSTRRASSTSGRRTRSRALLDAPRSTRCSPRTTASTAGRTSRGSTGTSASRSRSRDVAASLGRAEGECAAAARGARARSCSPRASARIRPGRDEKILTSWNALDDPRHGARGARVRPRRLARFGAARARLHPRDAVAATSAAARHVQGRPRAPQRLSRRLRVPARRAARAAAGRLPRARTSPSPRRSRDALLERFEDAAAAASSSPATTTRA